MKATKVNTAKLQQAIGEFGSLQKAIEVLELRKKEIETETITLTRDLDEKKRIKAKYSNELNQLDSELNQLDSSIKERTEKLNEVLASISGYLKQYLLFESLITMMQTPPHTVEDLEELAVTILIWSKTVWRSDFLPEKMRFLFVETVLGKYLHCYRCDRCGLKIIANQEVLVGNRCPTCTYMSTMVADDSFFEAMLSSSEPASANEAQEREE